MINHGIVQSTVRPKNKETTKTSIFINKNIKEFHKDCFDGFEYNQIQYSIEEYMQLQDDAITNLQIALIELYEEAQNNG